jgi:hypothetical protein
MRLRSTGAFANLANRRVAIGAQQLPQLAASTAAYPASNVHSPTNVRKGIVTLPSIMALAAGIAVVGGDATGQAARAEPIPHLKARVIAVNIPSASAISQVGTFLNVPPHIERADDLLRGTRVDALAIYDDVARSLTPHHLRQSSRPI